MNTKFWSKVCVCSQTSLFTKTTNPQQEDDTQSDNLGLSCGFSLKFCLRYSACLGLILSLFFISLGTVILLRTMPWSESNDGVEGSFYIYDRYMIYYTGNDQILFWFAVSLILINTFQVLADSFLFLETLRASRLNRVLLMKCLFFGNVVLWCLNLVSLVVILSGSGVLLLSFFLVGTSLRTYILASIHQLIAQFRKLSDSCVYPAAGKC